MNQNKFILSMSRTKYAIKVFKGPKLYIHKTIRTKSEFKHKV